ncbi:hypothetical protein CHH28_14000 [Bacterioplanes sanyensis]|uniref:Cation/multidrug efflux pump n=1 Tax=Bacterioplanes sanyensis TaxID=1249553 RepID=A0A222FLS8_9GAMM|nr:hypothetical protein [Bacterioplanes sanyensis]ASP39719.1 hypothetical protein CHH28_14000 [Bacterioplanes sanyensis]
MLLQALTATLVVLILVGLVMVAGFWRGDGWFRQWLKGTAGMISLALCVWLLLAALDLWSYQQLQRQHAIATVSVFKVEEQLYDLTLVDQQGTEQRFEIHGDQWQLDVRLLHWRGPIAAMADTPLYRLERLSGRYLTLEQERNAERSVYTLEESYWVDVWQSLRHLPLWLQPEFGSAVYMPLVNGAVYAVEAGGRGLTVKPVNDVAEAAVSQW